MDCRNTQTTTDSKEILDQKPISKCARMGTTGRQSTTYTQVMREVGRMHSGKTRSLILEQECHYFRK